MRPSQIHIDKALENISVAYQPMGLIASEFSPTVPVMKESDYYFVYSKDNLRIDASIWADGDAPNRTTWNLSSASYQLKRHGLRDLVTDRSKANADKAVAPEVDMTEAITHKILLRREFELMNIINTAANWGNITSLSATQVWSLDTTLSNPIPFVDSATTAIRRNSGKLANKIVMGEPTFKACKEHGQIVDRIKYTSSDSVGPDLLAKLFNVDKVLVSRGVRNAADEGLDDNLGDLATDLCLIVYNEPSPGLRKASAFYTFVQNGSSAPYRVRKYRDDELEGNWIEVSTFFQHKVVSSDCAYAINNTI